MNQELWQVLNDVKEKPGMYIGKPSLERLCHLMNGYHLCMYNRDHVFYEYLSGFQVFVEQYYGLFENIHSFHHWSDIIIFFSPSEKEAFYTFYELLDKYLKVEDEYSDVEKLNELVTQRTKRRMNLK